MINWVFIGTEFGTWISCTAHTRALEKVKSISCSNGWLTSLTFFFLLHYTPMILWLNNWFSKLILKKIEKISSGVYLLSDKQGFLLYLILQWSSLSFNLSLFFTKTWKIRNKRQSYTVSNFEISSSVTLVQFLVEELCQILERIPSYHFLPLDATVELNKTHYKWLLYTKDLPDGSGDKESACNAGDLCSIPGSGRSPGEKNGYPLWNSCLENSTDWEA